ncbi:hypothetical protein [Bacillus sp. FSL K6-3431]|uniref:hypothetical protein n=1 Tax=Bacillus sp. FSL K6-3431 TaxID=2921500 RepID=UPI0030FC1E12
MLSLSLREAIEEYKILCKVRNFTKKTMINKIKEAKQLTVLLENNHGITQLNQITTHVMKASLRMKRQAQLQPHSIHSMAKMIKALFNWGLTAEYVTENPLDKVDLPKIPKIPKSLLYIVNY